LKARLSLQFLPKEQFMNWLDLRWRATAALSAGIMLLPMLASGQSATLGGIVRDPDQRPVSEATITLTPPNKQAAVTQKTDSQGEYSFSSLAPGTYGVEADVQGFRPVRFDDVVIVDGSTVKRDFDLALATRNDSLQVTATSGYRAETASLSPVLGDRSLLDLPYSINVMPQPLIENAQSNSFASLYRINPLIQVGTTPDQGGNVTMRGFFQANYSGKTLDGMRYLFQIPAIEDKGSLEVLTGLSGFLFGPSNVGGTLNYTLKRPLPTPYGSVTIGDYGNKGAYMHVDLGGPLIPSGKLAYRFNIAGQDGGTPYGPQKSQRYIISGALDWHVTQKLLLQFSAADTSWNTDGSLPNWSYPTNPNGSSKIFHFAPPAADKLWNQTFTNSPQKSTDSGVRLNYDATSWLTFRGAYRISFFDQPTEVFSNNNITDTSGTYSQTLNKQGPIKYRQSAFYGFADMKFNTGSVKHLVTLGYFGDRYIQWRHSDSTSVTITGLSLAEPTYVAEPVFAPVGQIPIRRGSVSNFNNFELGDTMEFSAHWSATAGVTYSELVARSFNVATAALTSEYEKWKPTPSASIMYKPTTRISTYFTYLEGLEQGAIVPTSGLVYTNAGEVLPPFTDHQYEAGVKSNVGGMLLTAALFRIDRALQYGLNNNNGTYTYVQDGRQTDQGVELTGTGRLTHNLTFYGGATFFSAKVARNQANPLLNGKTPTDTAEQMIKGRLEYGVPRLRGLYLIGGVSWMGKRFVDTINTEELSPVAVGDLGLRYETNWRQPVIFRFDVTNVANETYWLTSLYTGAPRAFSVSMQYQLFGGR
jgi:iron complex outermembrane receptor protein